MPDAYIIDAVLTPRGIGKQGSPVVPVTDDGGDVVLPNPPVERLLA